MTPRPPRPPDPDTAEPLAEIGREPLHEAIASARDERRGGVSVKTLGIASAASAVASFTASHLWGSGTLLSAALTPVIVALASEFLRRPVDHVSSTALRVAPPRPSPLAPPQAEREPRAVAEGAGGRPAPAPRADWAPVSYGAPRRGWRPRWRLVLLTGLLAFVIVLGLYTVPDLLVGHSITGGGGSTTFFSSPGPPPAVQTQTQTQTQTQSTPTTPAEPAQTTTAPTPTTTEAAPQQTTSTTGTAPTTPTTPTATQAGPPGATTPTAPGSP